MLTSTDNINTLTENGTITKPNVQPNGFGLSFGVATSIIDELYTILLHPYATVSTGVLIFFVLQTGFQSPTKNHFLLDTHRKDFYERRDAQYCSRHIFPFDQCAKEPHLNL